LQLSQKNHVDGKWQRRVVLKHLAFCYSWAVYWTEVTENTS
jgi:hypothetical protein